ncbi:MAG: YdcF family protein [Pseudomonadota bacterium]
MAGFFRFLTVHHDAGNADERLADAIVVLTGGAARIETGLRLLRLRRGKRLLISGVNPATTVDQLVRSTKTPRRLFECCVDLGRVARNTEGNARETAAWAAAHGFDSLILVTSSYHMPRSVLEFSNALPGVKLIPHVVQRPSARWWNNPQIFSLFALEYSKFLLAWVRTGVFPKGQASQLAKAGTVGG